MNVLERECGDVQWLQRAVAKERNAKQRDPPIGWVSRTRHDFGGR